MKKTISSIQVEFFYDVPHIFSASDAVGCHYLCELVDQTDNALKYVCCPISHGRLKAFRLGEIDLRSIYINPEINDFYECYIGSFDDKHFELIYISSKELSPDYLPDSGFYLSKARTENVKIVEAAKAANKPIFQVTLNPPESKDGSVIYAERLSSFLPAFNSLIKHSYRKVCKQIPRNLDSLRYEVAHRLKIFEFAKGSFTIFFEPSDIGDFFGSCSSEVSFAKIDELACVLEHPEKSIEVLKRNKGHLVNAYIKVLEFIANNETSVEYAWASPTSPPKGNKLLHRFALPLLETLKNYEDISTEIIELTGKVIKADTKNCTWTIVNEEDQKEYSGKIISGSAITLEGIIISTQRYKFVCEETIEIVSSTGKEKSSYKLKDKFILS